VVNTFRIFALSAALLCITGGCSERPPEKPFVDGINHIRPIRLKFDPPVALVPPSTDKDGDLARYLLSAGLGADSISKEAVLDVVFQKAGQRYWFQEELEGWVWAQFVERSFSMEQLPKIKLAKDLKELLGEPEELRGRKFQVCNGKKGADFRAYQIIAGYGERARTVTFIYVSTGKPATFKRRPIRPIRLQFAGPVSLVPPFGSFEVFEPFKEEVVNGVFESELDPGERLWANGDATTFAHPFRERPAFSLDRLREAKTLADLEALLGKPEWSSKAVCWLVCNGKKGAEFRAYQIVVEFDEGGVFSIRVNTGKPVP